MDSQTKKQFKHLWDSIEDDFNAKKFGEAVVKASAALSLPLPTSHTARLHLARAVIYHCLTQFDKAEEDCNKARELLPRNPFVFNVLGIAHFYMGRPLEAVDDFTNALTLADPAEHPPAVFATLYNNRAAIYRSLNMFGEASADYDQAVLRDPMHADITFGRGCTFFEMGEYDRCLEDLRKAVSMAPLNYKMQVTMSRIKKFLDEERTRRTFMGVISRLKLYKKGKKKGTTARLNRHSSITMDQSGVLVERVTRKTRKKKSHSFEWSDSVRSRVLDDDRLQILFDENTWVIVRQCKATQLEERVEEFISTRHPSYQSQRLVKKGEVRVYTYVDHCRQIVRVQRDLVSVWEQYQDAEKLQTKRSAALQATEVKAATVLKRQVLEKKHDMRELLRRATADRKDCIGNMVLVDGSVYSTADLIRQGVAHEDEMRRIWQRFRRTTFEVNWKLELTTMEMLEKRVAELMHIINMSLDDLIKHLGGSGEFLDLLRRGDDEEEPQPEPEPEPVVLEPTAVEMKREVHKPDAIRFFLEQQQAPRRRQPLNVGAINVGELLQRVPSEMPPAPEEAASQQRAIKQAEDEADAASDEEEVAAPAAPSSTPPPVPAPAGPGVEAPPPQAVAAVAAQDRENEDDEQESEEEDSVDAASASQSQSGSSSRGAQQSEDEEEEQEDVEDEEHHDGAEDASSAGDEPVPTFTVQITPASEEIGAAVSLKVEGKKSESKSSEPPSPRTVSEETKMLTLDVLADRLHDLNKQNRRLSLRFATSFDHEAYQRREHEEEEKQKAEQGCKEDGDNSGDAGRRELLKRIQAMEAENAILRRKAARHADEEDLPPPPPSASASTVSFFDEDPPPPPPPPPMEEKVEGKAHAPGATDKLTAGKAAADEDEEDSENDDDEARQRGFTDLRAQMSKLIATSEQLHKERGGGLSSLPEGPS